MTEEKFIKKINSKFPNEKIEIIYAGKNSYEKSKVKCLKCDSLYEFNTGEIFRARRKFLCKKCRKTIRNDTKINRLKVKEKLENKAENIKFFMDKQSLNGNNGDKVSFKCRYCGRVNEMFVVNVLRNDSECNCGYCSERKLKKDTLSYQRELDKKFSKRFRIISQYVNCKTDIDILCKNCNKIIRVNPTKILRNGLCPNCNSFSSIGEEKIASFLKKKNILKSGT